MIQHLIETIKSGKAIEFGHFLYTEHSDKPVLVTRTLYPNGEYICIDCFPLEDKILREETAIEYLLNAQYISINPYWIG